MKKFLSIILFLFIATLGFAQSEFSVESLLKHKPNTLVNDFTKTLTTDQIQSIEHKLFVFDDSTSSQITVVIIPSLGGYDVADLAVELGRAWGVGGKEFNNGVVLLICTDKNNRKLNISPGYGLERVLPDVTCQHIIDDIIVPSFKGDDYYRGVDEGTDAIISAVKGEYKAPTGYHQKKGLSTGKVILIIILIIVFLSITSGGNKGGGFMSRRGYRGFDGPVIFPGFGGGWSGGGGGSSGGFGGFGGGSFGGGGASGSW